MKRRIIAEINVVPYIDVMLVLLIIFMVTAPLINQGVQVDLPSAHAKELSFTDVLPVVVSVNQHGVLYLNIAKDSTAPISEENLQVEVAAALARNNNRQIIMKADKNVSYDTVLQAMVLLQQAGAASIGLQTSDVT